MLPPPLNHENLVALLSFLSLDRYLFDLMARLETINLFFHLSAQGLSE